MRLFGRFVLAASVAFCLASGAAFAQDKKLKLGTEGAYPPFNYANADGTLGGFDIDLGKALCAEMKTECEFVVQDFDGSIPALQAGKFDAIINITITPERAEKVDFTRKYYQTPPAIAVPKIDDLRHLARRPEGQGVRRAERDHSSELRRAEIQRIDHKSLSDRR